MGNSIIEKFKSGNCCYNKININRSSSIKIENFNNTEKTKNKNKFTINIIEESIRQSALLEAPKNNLMNISSLKNIDGKSQISNSEINDQNIFSKSILNEDVPEEFNINENHLSNLFFFKIYDEINNARVNLLSYSKLIKKYAKKINMKKNKKNYLLSNGKKIYFEYDKRDFLECAEKLEKLNEELSNRNSLLKKLEYIEEIRFPLPKIDIEQVYQDDYIEKHFYELKNKFKGKYELKKLLFFKCTKDPEVSLLIQIIYDLKKRIKRNLLTEENKYININFRVLSDSMIGFFIIFAR